MISNKEANNKRFVSYNEEIRQLWLENLDHTDSKVLSKGETWFSENQVLGSRRGR